MTAERVDPELEGLRASVRDLTAVLALPMLWSGASPQHIAEGLVDVLVQLLRLDVAYMRLSRDAAVEAGRLATSRAPAPGDVATLLREVLDAAAPGGSATLDDGRVARTLRIPLGREDRGGLVVVGRAAPDFPTAMERFLVRATVNQAGVALQTALHLEALRESEERLRWAKDAAHLGIHDFDPQTGEIDWDERVRELWGVGREDRVDFATFLAGVHPDDRAAVQAAVDRALDPHGDGMYRSEYRVLDRRDGGTRWVAATGQATFENGRAVRLVGTAHDVTERKQMEEALREGKATLQSFFDSAPFLMGVAELDGDRLLAVSGNDAMAKLIGRATHELAGRAAPELGIPDATTREWIGAYRRCAAQAAPVQFDFEFLGSSGTRSFSATVAPLGATPGSRPRFSFVAVDISERKAAEAALREADRRKDEFLAMLAHELRNPLAPLGNAAELLRLVSEGDTPIRRVSEILERQIRHMSRLVDDLLDVSRITRGKIELRTERLRVREVIERAVETVGPAVEAAGHRLAVSFDAEAWVEADRVRLIQVVTNLLTNAIKFSPPGGRIRVSATRGDDAVVIAVRDSGIGLSREARERIFDLFQQEDVSAARGRGGLGIGLTLARRLVEMHEGSIDVTSEGPGRGSEFRVRLPRAEPPEIREESPSRWRPLDGSRRRILVVEDNADAAESFKLLLELNGHEVRIAHDGLEALRVFGDFEPEVAFVDLGLPGIDGFELARRLRSGDDRTTLVALSGYGREEDRERAFDAGFDEHLTKPADPGRILAMLSRAAPSGESAETAR